MHDPEANAVHKRTFSKVVSTAHLKTNPKINLKLEEEEGGATTTENNKYDLTTFAHNVVDQAEEVVLKIIHDTWNVCPFHKLPDWLQDNHFLKDGHRPPLPSISACFKSIFRLHTETGNIWTHLIGCVLFICLGLYWFIHPEINLQEKLFIGIFFAGAILCFACSFTFHTVSCHSEFMSKLFSKVDYCGISLLIMASTVPWLYYSFYCRYMEKVIYLAVDLVLGIATIIVSMMDKFSTPTWRPLRAGLFTMFGICSGLPAIHYIILEGKWTQSLEWFTLMAILYAIGAALYAVRIPERFFPGKFDIWLHSHQIFHVFVIGAALVHFHGVNELARYQLKANECSLTIYK